MIFFFALLSALRRSRLALVIRSFITLPARHSAVAANAISPDSHNYPRIERGKGERKKKISQSRIVGQTEFTWGRNACLGGEKQKRFFIFLNSTFLQFCLLKSESIKNNFQTASRAVHLSSVQQEWRMLPPLDLLIGQFSATYLDPAVGAPGFFLLLLLSFPLLQLEPEPPMKQGPLTVRHVRACTCVWSPVREEKSFRTEQREKRRCALTYSCCPLRRKKNLDFTSW